MSNFITHVYKLPSEEQARISFLEELAKLVARHGAEVTGGSKFDELGYIEILEQEFQKELGFDAAEDLRQDYERGRLSAPLA